MESGKRSSINTGTSSSSSSSAASSSSSSFMRTPPFKTLPFTADPGGLRHRISSAESVLSTPSVAAGSSPKTESKGAVQSSLVRITKSEKEIISDFYNDIIHRFAAEKVKEMKDNVEFIVVGHLVPTLPFYLEALNKIGTIAAVVAKGSIPDDDIVSWLKQSGMTKHIFTKDGFRQFKEELTSADRGNLTLKFKKLEEKEKAHRELPLRLDFSKIEMREFLAFAGPFFLAQITDPTKKIIIIDIGGYFSHTLRDLDDSMRSRVIGFVEDTENGHQKYNEVMKLISESKTDRRSHFPPLITVARSLIKDTEDYNVGKAITDATDHILRVSKYTHLAESKTILVIGYGKIGSAAARVAAEKTRGPVLICEIDPVRKLKASAHSFMVVDLIDGLRQADVIISCTGQKCLDVSHTKFLKHNVYIASCTSRGDEFSPSFLAQLGSTETRSDSVPEEKGPATESGLVKQYLVDGKIVNLLNDGSSVNFVQKAVHGYFIHGVLGSLAVSGIKLYHDFKGTPKELRSGVFNDFNDIQDFSFPVAKSSRVMTCQARIAEVLMQHKLRSGPTITNYESTSKRYIPRDKSIKELEDKLISSNIVCITGSKKTGKSQVIDVFYTINIRRYEIVWKFDASTFLEKQFEKLASVINSKIEEGKLIAEKIELSDPNMRYSEAVNSFLKNNRLPYLLAFEDADKDLADFIPEPTGTKNEHIILTASPSLEVVRGEKLLLEKFPDNELFKFLINDEIFWRTHESKLGELAAKFASPITKSSGESKDEANISDSGEDVGNDEVEFVGALNLTASWLIRQHKTKPDFDVDKDLLGKIRDKEGHVIELCLKMFVEELSKEALTILFGFYVPSNIKFILPAEKIERIAQKAFGTKKAIKELEEKGFIKRENEFLIAVYQGNIINKLYTDTCNNSINLKITIKAIIKKLCSYRKDELPNFKIVKVAEKIAKYMQQEENFYSDWRKKNPSLAFDLYKRLAYYFEQSREYSEAILYYELAVAEQEKFLATGHAEIAKIKALLGSLYLINNNSEKGIEALEEALTIYNQQAESRSIQIASIKSKLIIAYCDGKGETYGREALAVFTQMGLKKEEALTYSRLGVYWRNKQDFGQAENHFKAARTIYSRMGIRDDASLLYDYAILKKNKGEYFKALDEFNKTMDTMKATSGKSSHPYYYRMLKELTLVYKELGDYENAEKLIHRILQTSPMDLSLIKAEIYKDRAEEEREQREVYLKKADEAIRQTDKKDKYILECDAELKLAQGNYEHALQFSEEQLKKLKDEKSSDIDYKSQLLLLKAKAVFAREKKLTPDLDPILREVQEICSNPNIPLGISAESSILLAEVFPENLTYLIEAIEKRKKSLGEYFTIQSPKMKKIIQLARSRGEGPIEILKDIPERSSLDEHTPIRPRSSSMTSIDSFVHSPVLTPLKKTPDQRARSDKKDESKEEKHEAAEEWSPSWSSGMRLGDSSVRSVKRKRSQESLDDWDDWDDSDDDLLEEKLRKISNPPPARAASSSSSAKQQRTAASASSSSNTAGIATALAKAAGTVDPRPLLSAVPTPPETLSVSAPVSPKGAGENFASAAASASSSSINKGDAIADDYYNRYLVQGKLRSSQSSIETLVSTWLKYDSSRVGYLKETLNFSSSYENSPNFSELSATIKNLLLNPKKFFSYADEDLISDEIIKRTTLDAINNAITRHTSTLRLGL